MSDQVSKIIPMTLPKGGGINWTQVFEENEESLRGLILGRLAGGGESSVNDILQEVSIAAHGVGVGEVEPEKAAVWLRQVAMNKVKDFWRKVERKRRLHDRYNEGADEESVSPYEWVMALERSELISEALSKLGKEERKALVGKYINGESCRLIAEREGLPEKSVEYRLSKARKQMRFLLGKTLGKLNQ